jgi:hypothetical protein
VTKIDKELERLHVFHSRSQKTLEVTIPLTGSSPGQRAPHVDEIWLELYNKAAKTAAVPSRALLNGNSANLIVTLPESGGRAAGTATLNRAADLIQATDAERDRYEDSGRAMSENVQHWWAHYRTSSNPAFGSADIRRRPAGPDT